MFGVLLSTDPVMGYQVLHPGILMFGVLLALYGATLGLLPHVLRREGAWREVFWLQAGVLVVLALILVLELLGWGGASGVSLSHGLLSARFATHRWFMFLLPLLLTASSLITLWVYKDALSKEHAHAYRRFAFFSIVASFVVLLLIAFESII